MRAQPSSVVKAMCLATAVLAATTAQAKKNTMEDLKALAEQESWQELFNSLGDIAPAQRKAEWKGLLEKAAVGYLEALSGQEDQYAAFGLAKGILVQYPTLKKNADFMKKRGEVGLTALSKCFDNTWASADCSLSVEEFVKVDPQNHALAFEAGKLLRLRGGPAVAVRLFKLAVGAKGSSKEYCKEEQLALAVMWGLGSPAKDPPAVAAREVAFKGCFAELKPAILDEFAANGGRSYFAENTCKDLKSAKALTKFQLALCDDAQGK